jgi:hypothetical protein
MAVLTNAAGDWQTQGRVRYLLVPPRLALIGAPLAGVAPQAFGPKTMAQARDGAAGIAPLALVDGPMFSVCGAENERRAGETDAQRYRRYTCGRPDYRLLDTARGIDVAGRFPTRGATFSVMANGAVSVASGNVVAPGAAVAVQGYPPLVRDGVNVASNVGPNAERNWRVALCLAPDGNLAFAAGSEDMVSFGVDLRAAGFRQAVYLDGGGTARVLRVQSGAFIGSTEDRRAPLWIAAVALAGAPPAPTPGPSPAPAPTPGGPRPQPPASGSSRAGLVMAGVAIAALAGVVAATRE